MSYISEPQVETSLPFLADLPSLHTHALSSLTPEQAFSVVLKYGLLEITFEPGVAREQHYTLNTFEVDALIADLMAKRAVMGGVS